MQITNNYQPSFLGKKSIIERSAKKIMQKRTSPEQVKKLEDEFKKACEEYNKYDIIIGTADDNSGRLDAIITYENQSRYIKESMFACLFSTPKKFFDKVYKKIDQDILSIVKKGYIV